MARPISANAQASLTLRRIFSAPIEEVFDAWTKPEALVHWFRPVGFTVTATEIDLRLGGKYLIVIQPANGAEIRHFGVYTEINPPERLAFTWMIENQACGGSANQCAETLVSIEFRRAGLSTEVRLTHEHLPNKAAYDGHEFGWNSTFDCLEEFVLTKLR